MVYNLACAAEWRGCVGNLSMSMKRCWLCRFGIAYSGGHPASPVLVSSLPPGSPPPRDQLLCVVQNGYLWASIGGKQTRDLQVVTQPAVPMWVL